jgi:hypothetical protein
MNFFNKNLKTLIFAILVALFFLTNISSIQAQTENNITNLQFIQQLLQSLLDQLQLLQAQILQQPTTVTTTTTSGTTAQPTPPPIPINSYISVYSPRWHQLFTRGSVMSIGWYISGDIDRVSIELRKGDKPYAIIKSNVPNAVPNAGFYNWTIPSTFPTGTDYKIRITDQSNLNIYGESGYFSVLDKSSIPSIRIISPNGGEKLREGDMYKIQWEALNVPSSEKFPARVYIEIRRNDGASLFLGSFPYDQREYLWKVTTNLVRTQSQNNQSIYNYSYKVDIGLVWETGSVSDISDDWFYITPVKKINILYPRGPEILTPGSKVNIQWESTDDISRVTIELYKGDKLYSVLASNIPNRKYFTWTIPMNFATGNDYRIRVSDSYNSKIFSEPEYPFSIVPSANVVSEEVKCFFKGLVPGITAGCNPAPNNSILYSGNKNLGCNTENEKGQNPCTVYVKGIEGDKIGWRSTCFESDLYTLYTTVDGQNEYLRFDCRPIRIYTPIENIVYKRGSNLNIAWGSAEYVSDRVFIELHKGDSPYAIIKSNVPNIKYAKSYNWTIPSTFPTGTDYKIRITDQSNRNIYGESGYFRIQ